MHLRKHTYTRTNGKDSNGNSNYKHSTWKQRSLELCLNWADNLYTYSCKSSVCEQNCFLIIQRIDLELQCQNRSMLWLNEMECHVVNEWETFHTSHQKYAYLSTHTVYQYKIHFFHYLGGNGLKGKLIQENIIFMRFCCCFELSEKIKKTVEQATNTRHRQLHRLA